MSSRGGGLRSPSALVDIAEVFVVWTLNIGYRYFVFVDVGAQLRNQPIAQLRILSWVAHLKMG